MAQTTPKITVTSMEVDSVEVQNVTVGTNATSSVNTKLHRGGIGELEIVQGDDATPEGTRSGNKVQLNVKNAAIGTNPTLTNNVKLHRGGNGELGFVLADDTELEGSRSSNHALIQAKSLVLGDSPNQSFNVKLRRAGNGLLQFTTANDNYVDGVFSPNYADVLGSVPVGSIIAWNPGYYQDSANGTFTKASFLATNDVTGANAYLNSRGYFVADGSQPNLPSSLIWNTAGRYLPNLTDDRFLMGSTSVGNLGGSNTLVDHTHSSSLTVDAHTHSIDHDHASVTSAGEGSGTNLNISNHDLGSITGGAPNAGTTHNYVLTTDAVGSSFAVSHTSSADHTHEVDVAAYTGTSGSASSSSISGTIGSGSAPSSTENRPKYLSAFFIVRVF